MNTATDNRPLIATMIVIGIIIIILLIARGGTTAGRQYSYGNLFTASAVPLDAYSGSYADNGYVYRRIVPTTTTAYSRPSTSTYTTYSYYPQNDQTYYDYSSQYQHQYQNN